MGHKPSTGSQNSHFLNKANVRDYRTDTFKKIIGKKRVDRVRNQATGKQSEFGQ
jgi:hypothetical protein